MKNPWEQIPLNDYENHMKLDSVQQLQGLNELMKGQVGAYPVSSLMILGAAGGNGFEHIRKDKFEKVYAVDINPDYLEAATSRYPGLSGVLECLCVDLTGNMKQLPKADMVIANLIVEYIGYECFQKAVQRAAPGYVSCVIQINREGNWVSDSPYLHVFDGLDQVHHQMEEQALSQAMLAIGYRAVKKQEHGLPNGKTFVRLDFERETAL